jgi:aspartate racemase
MGPEATAALYLGIINRCQRELGAKYNSDFPQIIINSSPVPDGRMWNGFSPARVERFLRYNVRILERAGVDFIAIPCNSVHYFLPEMRKAVHVPVLSIVEETAGQVKRQNLQRVLLLSTTFTANRAVYDEVFSEFGIELVKPKRTLQRLVEEIIIRVESGKRLSSDKKRIKGMMRDLKRENGIQGVVAGCTEIPLLVSQKDVPIPLFDTIAVLASASYDLIVGRRGLENIGSAR